MANILTSPRRSMEEVEKAARKKGRAYWCLRCLHRSDKEYIDVKYRMEAHIIKDHLRRDEVPYYCSLCQFRCTKEEELNDHLTRYRRHRTVALQSKLDPMDSSCLKTNPQPYKIGPKDYLVMEKEESFEHWKSCILRRQASIEPEPDSLAQAMAEVLGDFEGPAAVSCPTSDKPDQPVFIISDPPLSELPTVPPAAITLPEAQIREAVSPLLQQLSTILSPAMLSQMLNPAKAQQTQSIPTLPVAEPKVTQTVTQFDEAVVIEAPKAIANDPQQRQTPEEDLLEQLLPQEDQGITPKRKLEGNVIPNKRMRSRSPSPATSNYSTSSQESANTPIKSQPSATNENMQMNREIRGLTNVVMTNTMALRSLEKSVLTLAEAVNTLTKNMKTKTQPKRDDDLHTQDENKNKDGNKHRTITESDTRHVKETKSSRPGYNNNDKRNFKKQPFQHRGNGGWNNKRW